MSSNRILVFSSSREGESGFLETVVPVIHSFLGAQPLKIAFIPFAAVEKTGDGYLSMVNAAFEGLAYSIELVVPSNAKSIIEQADVIMTGGGNTFKLLHDIYQYKLLDLIRDKVNSGAVYIGWSAGANIAGPTIGTTNDMPIVEPHSFNSLGLFPFQLNPHYFNKPIEGFNGESRDQRLMEFSKMNPGLPIVCLPEGTALQLENNLLTFIGKTAGSLFYFENDEAPSQRLIKVGEDLSFLM
ncbi:MAG: dipeptidase PepE [Ferruginibacter sp.]|nr:dipeptidase PepE [Ferruginibacter sp.]